MLDLACERSCGDRTGKRLAPRRWVQYRLALICLPRWASIDPTRHIRWQPGRIGCGSDEYRCIGSTGQPGFREVPANLAQLEYVPSFETVAAGQRLWSSYLNHIGESTILGPYSAGTQLEFGLAPASYCTGPHPQPSSGATARVA
jgi:hypothetical protein